MRITGNGKPETGNAFCGSEQRLKDFPDVFNYNIVPFGGRVDTVRLVEFGMPSYTFQEKGNERDPLLF